MNDVILRPAKGKHAGLLLLSLLFVVIGVHAGEVTGWLVAAFFGLGVVVFTMQLIPNASYLRLTEQGFEVSSLFTRWPLFRWTEVSEFRTAPVGRTTMVVFDCDIETKLARANRVLTGASHALPDTYGKKPEELAALMNSWRRQAR